MLQSFGPPPISPSKPNFSRARCPPEFPTCNNIPGRTTLSCQTWYWKFKKKERKKIRINHEPSISFLPHRTAVSKPPKNTPFSHLQSKRHVTHTFSHQFLPLPPPPQTSVDFITRHLIIPRHLWAVHSQHSGRVSSKTMAWRSQSFRNRNGGPGIKDIHLDVPPLPFSKTNPGLHSPAGPFFSPRKKKKTCGPAPRKNRKETHRSWSPPFRGKKTPLADMSRRPVTQGTPDPHDTEKKFVKVMQRAGFSSLGGFLGFWFELFSFGEEKKIK